jgi:hypothetical protein
MISFFDGAAVRYHLVIQPKASSIRLRALSQEAGLTDGTPIDTAP